MTTHLRAWLWMVVTAGCAGTPSDTGDTDVPAVSTDVPKDTAFPELVEAWDQLVQVNLDGAPLAGATVLQGGSDRHQRTDAQGRATVRIDPTIEGGPTVVAAHPAARIVGEDLRRGALPLVTLDLVAYDTSDNEAYVFQDPGTPTRNSTTAYCSHCHIRQTDDWITTPHASAASNPVLHDVYMGTAMLARGDCLNAGGTWEPTRLPGGGTAERCRLGTGVLPDLNEACEPGALCDEPDATGACADCHAPGIDGELGGRDLLDATGISHDSGVHCDVCHKVADIDLDAPAGVGGRLTIVRPSEPTSMTGFDWAPLTFGPLLDVLNPRMGSVPSPLHREARFCAGCHEHDQAALVPGTALDAARWPDGVLPIHSTYTEWAAGPLAEVSPCQACHMPPEPLAGNSADIDLQSDDSVGRPGGWRRPPGTSRRHLWAGPRSSAIDMLGLALTAEVQVAARDRLDPVRATVTVSHTGPGHAVPTGEPMRSVVVHVTARCVEGPLRLLDGPLIPSYGGYKASKEADEDWSVWPEAQVGDVVRVVRRDGWQDYTGVGRFGDGSFDAEAKGLPNLRLVGERRVTAVGPGGLVTFDTELPVGHIAFLGATTLTLDGEAAPLAGAPGTAFARVLVDEDGHEMVPHHRAVDIRSDNRLVPGAVWRGDFTFEEACAVADTQVTATVSWRAYPWALAVERGWSNPDRRMAEVVR